MREGIGNTGVITHLTAVIIIQLNIPFAGSIRVLQTI